MEKSIIACTAFAVQEENQQTAVSKQRIGKHA
jgi:hypothetical protein